MHAGKLYIIFKNGLNPGTVRYQKCIFTWFFILSCTEAMQNYYKTAFNWFLK